MEEGDVESEKPESIITGDSSEKKEVDEKSDELEVNHGVLTNCKGGELDTMQIDEPPGTYLDNEETDKGKETVENVESATVVEVEKEESKEGVEKLDEDETLKDEEKHSNETEDKDEEAANTDGKENNEKNSKVVGSKKRPRTKSKRAADEPKLEEEENDEKEVVSPKEKKKKDSKPPIDEKEEPKTPTAISFDRPVRERKSVERLVATIEKDSGKDFHIAKGRGVALKDIPNVAYKLSRKKTEETFKLLHTILFGRRGKAAQVKSNISRFSGFVWHDDEEKQMNKVKEKLDKCIKEKLVEFCDVLDIPISSKASIRKEDLVTKLVDFLLKPHATTSELLADKDQSSKKRKRSSKSTSESKKKEEKIKRPASDDDDDSGGGGEEEENANGGSRENSDDEISEPTASEEKVINNASSEESDQKTGKKKSVSKKTSETKKPVEKVVAKKAAATPTPKKESAKSLSTQNKKTTTTTPNKKQPVKNMPTSKQSVAKERTGGSSGKKAAAVNAKKDKKIAEKIKPSDDELKNAVCEILKEVDFNTATFTDILKLLAKKFDVDLAPRKAGIKLMIQEELTKLADAEDDEEEEEEEEEEAAEGEEDGKRKAVKV